MATTCRLCGVRRSKRYCPGVGDDICAICCGTEREVTVSCPFECPYLQDSRAFSRLPDLDPDTLPSPDVPIDEAFLEAQGHLLAALSLFLLESALETPGALDTDTRDALAALTRTLRTRDTGLYYETRPDNLVAAAIQERLERKLDAFRQRVAERTGSAASLREKDVLGILIHLQRLEVVYNNGRPKGRAFLHFLRQQFPLEALQARADEPRLIL